MKRSSTQAVSLEKLDSPIGEDPSSTDSELVVGQPERDRKIAEAAYYRAEARGFAAGHEMEDWLEAESEIDGDNPADMLGASQL